MKPVATGYKIFNPGFIANQLYCYADNNGIAEGSIHKVAGDISICEKGLHFCKSPLECFRYYAPLQWNVFAKVEAYDKIIEAEGKCVTNILKIVKVLSFREFIDECANNSIRGGNYIRGGNDISGGNSIWGAYKCEGVSCCIFCYDITGKLKAFNKDISRARFQEIWDNLEGFGWNPDYTNTQKLRGDKLWEETNAPEIRGVDKKTVWASMPKEMEEYIKSLPEYDEKIFNIITGREEEEAK